MNIPYEYHLEHDHYTRSAPILLGSDHSIDGADMNRKAAAIDGTDTRPLT